MRSSGPLEQQAQELRRKTLGRALRTNVATDVARVLELLPESIAFEEPEVSMERLRSLAPVAGRLVDEWPKQSWWRRVGRMTVANVLERFAAGIREPRVPMALYLAPADYTGALRLSASDAATVIPALLSPSNGRQIEDALLVSDDCTSGVIIHDSQSVEVVLWSPNIAEIALSLDGIGEPLSKSPQSSPIFGVTG